MFDRGFVDFFAHSIYFQGQWSGGLTFASKEKFKEEHLDIFRAIVPALSAVVETHASKIGDIYTFGNLFGCRCWASCLFGTGKARGRTNPSICSLV